MGNWIVAGILAVIVILIVRYLVRQRKSGQGCCGGSCKTCAHCSKPISGCAECKDCEKTDA